jgi:hypothetical protein
MRSTRTDATAVIDLQSLLMLIPLARADLGMTKRVPTEHE